VFLDTTHLKRRVTHHVGSRAMVSAPGVTMDRGPYLLGLAFGDPEDTAFWSTCLPRSRGLSACIWSSPTTTAIKAAVSEVMIGVARQRSQVHFMCNGRAGSPRPRPQIVPAATGVCEPDAGPAKEHFTHITAPAGRVAQRGSEGSERSCWPRPSRSSTGAWCGRRTRSDGSDGGSRGFDSGGWSLPERRRARALRLGRDCQDSRQVDRGLDAFAVGDRHGPCCAGRMRPRPVGARARTTAGLRSWPRGDADQGSPRVRSREAVASAKSTSSIRVRDEAHLEVTVNGKRVEIPLVRPSPHLSSPAPVSQIAARSAREQLKPFCARQIRRGLRVGRPRLDDGDKALAVIDRSDRLAKASRVKS